MGDLKPSGLAKADVPRWERGKELLGTGSLDWGTGCLHLAVVVDMRCAEPCPGWALVTSLVCFFIHCEKW